MGWGAGSHTLARDLSKGRRTVMACPPKIRARSRSALAHVLRLTHFPSCPACLTEHASMHTHRVSPQALLRNVRREPSANRCRGHDTEDFGQFSLARLPEVVIRLHRQPHFGAGAQGGLEAQCHGRAGARSSIQKPRQGLTCDPEPRSRVCDALGARKEVAQDFAGVGGSVHAAHNCGA